MECGETIGVGAKERCEDDMPIEAALPCSSQHAGATYWVTAGAVSDAAAADSPSNACMKIRWDSGRTTSFEASERSHLDYGYTMFSHLWLPPANPGVGQASRYGDILETVTHLKRSACVLRWHCKISRFKS